MPIISGTPSGDVLNGTSGDDQIFGLGGDDFITGGGGADYIDGGDGDDFIRGSEGADVMRGGAGADVFALDGDVQPRGSVYDLIVDFQTGIDRIATIFVPFEISIVRQGGSSFVFMRSFNGAGLSVMTAFGDINARDFGDIDRQGGAVTMVGSTQNDVLVGGAGQNYIFGGDGADAIDGGAGDDILTGGRGDDDLRGGAGRDFFVFNAADPQSVDRVRDFTRGDDRITFQSSARDGLLMYFNADGTTSLRQAQSSNTVVISGVVQPSDIDLMAPTDVRTQVEDYSGDRIIIGSDRPEAFIGFDGQDIIQSGGGADQFFYTRALDSLPTAMDIITDFQSGVDVIAIQQFARGTTVNVAYNANGAFIFVDVGGDGTNDMIIGLSGVTRLAASDIILTFVPSQAPERLAIEPILPSDSCPQPHSSDWYLSA